MGAVLLLWYSLKLMVPLLCLAMGQFIAYLTLYLYTNHHLGDHGRWMFHLILQFILQFIYHKKFLLNFLRHFQIGSFNYYRRIFLVFTFPYILNLLRFTDCFFNRFIDYLNLYIIILLYQYYAVILPSISIRF